MATGFAVLMWGCLGLECRIYGEEKDEDMWTMMCGVGMYACQKDEWGWDICCWDTNMGLGYLGLGLGLGFAIALHCGDARCDAMRARRTPQMAAMC
eukprot:1545664-Rhodomonas_salina.6